MSAEAPFLTRSFKVGRRTCSVSFQRPKAGVATHAVFEWDPDVPKRLTLAELAQYRAGRDLAIAELSAELGLSVALVEI